MENIHIELMNSIAFFALYFGTRGYIDWGYNCVLAFAGVKKGVYRQVNTLQASDQNKLTFLQDMVSFLMFLTLSLLVAFPMALAIPAQLADIIAAAMVALAYRYKCKDVARWVRSKQKEAGLIEYVKCTDRYYISVDLETGDFCTPYLDEQGNWQQGSHTAPILQYAHIVTDKYYNELGRFQVFINDESRMGGFKESTRNFHKKTGFLTKWEEADKVSLQEAERMIIDSLKEIIGDDLAHYRGAKSTTQLNILGKSASFDVRFLEAQAPNLSRYFSHQLNDVSVIKPVLVDRKKVVRGLSSVVSTHDALDDCVSAIEEAKVLAHLVDTIPDTDAYADRALGLRK